jgi:hypothetical protein
MAFVHQMNFVKRSYDSLVYIQVREMEPIKIYDSNHGTFDRWLNALLSRSGWFNWDITSDKDMDTVKDMDSVKDPEIVWKMKDGSNPLEETIRDKVLGTD